jgi:glucose-1-phosphate cytidylyltransferase
MHSADITVDLSRNEIVYHNSASEPWKITIVDTGLYTMTGGRLKRIQRYINNETFMMTYGDGLSDINIRDLLDYHLKNKKLATLTAVLPSGKFGAVEIAEDNHVVSFYEKPKGDGSWVNGGFFILEPGVFDYVTGDAIMFEKEPLENLAADGQLHSLKHKGFWKPMDTLRDKQELQKLWDDGNAPWKVWHD